jgi:ADP-heptose:LPS heptosyltransferase
VRAFSHAPQPAAHAGTALPAVLLSRYLFFLTQRPISRSNTHYVRQRIHGMQSLGRLLAEADEELLSSSLRLLHSLDPGNLHEVSERLQLTLFPFARADIPATYISAEAPPPPEFLRSSERILLVLGPAIGIGDEIVTFPLPQWIKRANPAAHLTTLTAYEGLWDGVAAVDHVATYRDHDAVVRAMRGEHDVGKADLVLLVDFENPELYRAVTAEREIARYAELSLGARVLAAVDNVEGWTYHQTLPVAYFRNVYDGFDELARRLGVTPEAADRLDGTRSAAANGDLRVFVSPFSSKYDPSPRYWSTLLSTLIPEDAGRPVQFVLDPGPNGTTQRFASEVTRAAAARNTQPAVSHTVAAADGTGRLSLSGVFAELRRADVVLCADSFAAHASPRMACTTFVVASPGLENWRVPSDHSYYFDAEAPIGELVSGMRQLLELHGIGAAAEARPSVGAAEERLARADAELGRAVTADASLTELCAAYERFRAARDEVIDRLARWPASAATLTGDYAYELPARDLNGDSTFPAELEPDTRSFVKNHWLTWRNTNLRKYLDSRLRESRA